VRRLFHLIYTDVKRYGLASQTGAGGGRCATFQIAVTSARIDAGWSIRSS
jgi:hypothetical protein